MDLCALVSGLNFRLAPRSVAATVTRPAPDSGPITTRAIWVTPDTEAVPFGVDYQRREPRKVLALARADVSTAPIGTRVVAPETPGGVDVTWLVDGMERVETEHVRVIVVRCED